MTRPIGTTSYRDQIWVPVQTELEAIHERIQELADWASEEGEAPAVGNKLHEALGPLWSALEGCAQYRVGLLPQAAPMTAFDVPCERCTALVGESCIIGTTPPASYAATGRHRGETVHVARIELAGLATRRRDSERMAEAEALLS